MSLIISKKVEDQFCESLKIIFNTTTSYLDNNIFSYIENNSIEVLKPSIYQVEEAMEGNCKQILQVCHIQAALKMILLFSSGEVTKTLIKDGMNQGMNNVCSFSSNEVKPTEYVVAKDKLRNLCKTYNISIDSYDEEAIIYFCAFIKK